MYSDITPETTKTVVDTYVDQVQIGSYPDANPLDQAIATYISQLRDALQEVCKLANGYIYTPPLGTADAPPTPPSSWSGTFTSDWTKPFRDKERVAELAKLAQVEDQTAHRLAASADPIEKPFKVTP